MSDHDHKVTELLRYGGWLPASLADHRDWLKKQVAACKSQDPEGHFPLQADCIEELRDMIKNDPDMYMGFNRMLEGGPITDYRQLLQVMDTLLDKAPTYGPVGPPFYMLLQGAITTQGGFTAFLADKLNAQLKKILGVWAEYLGSDKSTYVLTRDSNIGGWFSDNALTALEKPYDGERFENVFKCDTSAQHWGFKSWDDFFTRSLRDGVRPVGYPEQTNAISAACESAFYREQKNAQEEDQFWIKGEPYSLRHMLNADEDYAEKLYGGSVFQGFLSVTSYHRWHSPVTGTIKKIVTVPGTYYVQSPALLGSQRSEGSAYFHSQSFLASMAARMLIFIQSSNRKIGLMCFIAIGMVEVSTCEATVKVGQTVKRGDELGMFHFGGSSHCLVFGPNVDVKWVDEVTKPGERIKVRSVIGAVKEE